MPRERELFYLHLMASFTYGLQLKQNCLIRQRPPELTAIHRLRLGHLYNTYGLLVGKSRLSVCTSAPDLLGPIILVKFVVLIVGTTKGTVFQDVTPFSPTETYRRLRRTSYIQL
jgi:hypothetical protein